MTKPPGLPGFLLSLLVIIIAGAACFALIGAALFAIAYGAQGQAGVRALASMFDLSRLGALSGANATALFALAAMLYASIIGGVLIAARLWGGRSFRDLVAWHGPYPQWRMRYWPWLLAIPLYHLVAGTLLRLLYPEISMNLRLPAEALALGLSFLAIVILAPLAEELFFRGWLYGALRARLSANVAIFVCAFVFAIAHWDGMGLYPIAVFAPGLVLTIIRERTGSAKATFLVHAIYNFAGWIGLAAISIIGG